MGLLVLHVAATAVWVSVIGLRLGRAASFDGVGWVAVRVLAIVCSFVAGIGLLHLDPTHLSSWTVRVAIGILLLFIFVDHFAHADDHRDGEDGGEQSSRTRSGWLALPATLAILYFLCLWL